MTISAAYIPNRDNGNGVTTVFAVNFPFGAGADLAVILFDTIAQANVSPAPLLNGSATYDYTVSGTPDPDTGIYPSGSVTFNTAPLATYVVVRARTTPQLQGTVLKNNSRFPAKSVEGSFDRQEMQMQERADAVARALVIPLTDAPLDMTIPPLAVRKGGILGFDQVTGQPSMAVLPDIIAMEAIAAAAEAAAAAATGVAGPTPEMYGAKGDAVIGSAGAIASGSHDFSDANITFTAADLGKTIGIMGAGAAGVTLITTISALAAAHHVTLTAAAGATVTGAHYAYGSDDSVALAAFFAANVGKCGGFENTSAYISTAALSCQMRLLDCRDRPLIFLIGNHTSDCFTSAPPNGAQSDRVGTRFKYSEMWLDAMATGRDLLVLTNGKPNLPGMTLDNSYRDAILVKADGTLGSPTSFENLNGNFWIVRNAGRHGIHLYLKGNADTAIQTFINETYVTNFSISGIGRRFGSGGAGSANACNACRITYDAVVGDNSHTANKVSVTRFIGANWDALNGGAVAVDAIGDVIFHNAINATTWRRVEVFDFDPGGVESSDGVTVPNSPKLITGSAMVAGDWIECDLEQGVPFAWGFGINDALLSDPADGNTYEQNSPDQGAMTYRRFKARPGDTIYNRAIWADAAAQAPLGPTIDYNFRNVPQPFAYSKVLVASSAVNIDIPIQSLTAPANEYTQWPLVVRLLHGTFPGDQTYTTTATFEVLLGYSASGVASSVVASLISHHDGADLTKSFNPATGVAWSIQSSSGNLKDILRCSITGGASIGGGGALKNVELMASRFGMGTSEIQRQFKGGAVDNNEFPYRV